VLLSVSSAVFLLGLFIGMYTDVPVGVGISLLLLFLSYILLSLIPSFRWAKAGRLSVALSCLLLIGALWQQRHQSDLRSDPLVYLAGTAVNVKGYVDEEPLERGGHSRWRFKVEEIDDGSGWIKQDSRLLVYSQRFPSHNYGEKLVLEGRLEAPSDVFGREYKEYLGRKGIHYILSFPSVQHDGQAITPYYPVAFLRNSLAGSLQKALPEPQASLSQGMLLDLRGKIPNDLLDTFANTGTTHILAISGQNFSMVISLLILGITKLVGRRHPIVIDRLIMSHV